MIRIIFQIFAASLLLAGCAGNTVGAQTASSNPASPVKLTREPVTILISIDGFRPDYLERGITPNLSSLAASGVTANMRSSFPTKTFPNHWTLVTGKRPDNHGIIGNTMEDPRRPGEIFKMATKDPFWWNTANPIWSTAEQQGVRSATMFWPGSEVQWKDPRKRPSDWWPFSMDLTNDRRVDAVVDWMRRPAPTRPQLVTLYFDTVDTAGHYFGPAAGDKLHQAITALDIQIGRLVDQLKSLEQPTNLVIVSDHGMAETSPDRVIYLDQIMPRDRYRLVVDGNYAGIEPISGNSIDDVRDAFVRPHDHMQCWERQDIPAALQYGQNQRVPSILCLPESGWVVYQDKPEWMTGIGGGHGYDHRHPDMIAFFLASGPAIRAGSQIPIFDNVDIYSLLAHLAGVKAEDSDGTLNTFTEILLSDK